MINITLPGYTLVADYCRVFAYLNGLNIEILLDKGESLTVQGPALPQDLAAIRRRIIILIFGSRLLKSV
ncbi:MAG: hypothetical protein V3W52_17225 [Syntrophobacteria bacterium]